MMEGPLSPVSDLSLQRHSLFHYRCGVRQKQMNIRFYRNPETGLPHIYEHGVDEDEVEDILLNLGEDWVGSRKSRNALGQTQSGRYLQVVYVRDPQPNSVFVITAYELTGKPLRAYRRRQQKRGVR